MTECEANHRMEGRDAVLLKYEYNSVLVSDSFIYVTEIMFQMKEETRREKFKCWLTLGMKHEGVDAWVLMWTVGLGTLQKWSHAPTSERCEHF